MFTLQKISDTTKQVETYNTVTGSYTETYPGATAVTFATKGEADAVMQLINDSNDSSNHVEVIEVANSVTENTTATIEEGDDWILYNLENEEELMESYDSAYNPTITTVEERALGLSEAQANSLAPLIVGIWGTRARKPKPKP